VFSERCGAIELKRSVDLCERKVTSNLDGSVAAACDFECGPRASCVKLDRTGAHVDISRRERGLAHFQGTEHIERWDRQKASVERECEITVIARDRIMNRDELRTVRERPFDLHVVHKLGNTREHLPSAEDPSPDVHEVGHGATVANELKKLRGEQGNRLGVTQAEATREALLREKSSAVKDQFVEVARRKVHGIGSVTRNEGIHDTDVWKVSEPTAGVVDGKCWACRSDPHDGRRGA
jgi:hypothetical protein